MGFKRLVSLACDGPCGTVLPDAERAPVGWSKLTVGLYERLAEGQKGTPPETAYLCPPCRARFDVMMHKGHFNLNSKGKGEGEEHKA